MNQLSYEYASVLLANKLIMDLKLPVPRISDPHQITSSLYVHLLGKICGYWPPGAVEFPQSPGDDFRNVRLVLESLQNKFLRLHLPHINPEMIVKYDARSVHNLLEIFKKYLDLFPRRILKSKNEITSQKSPKIIHVCSDHVKKPEQHENIHVCPSSTSKIIHTCPLRECSLPSETESILEQSLSSSDIDSPVQLRFSSVSETNQQPKQVRFQDEDKNNRKWKSYFVRTAKTYGFNPPQLKYRKIPKDSKENIDLLTHIQQQLPTNNIPTVKIRHGIPSFTSPHSDPVKEYLKTELNRHEALKNHFEKQLLARERKINLDAKRVKYLKIRNQLTDQKILSCRLRKLKDEQECKRKSNLLSVRNKEEILFSDIYKEGLNAQQVKIREIIKRIEQEEQIHNEEELSEIISKTNQYKSLLEMKPPKDFYFQQDARRIKSDLWKAEYIFDQ